MPLSERQTTYTPDAEAVLSFANKEQGAERRILERVAEAVVLGRKVHEDLQQIANALLIKALLCGKLPQKAAGRPKSDEAALKGVELAHHYFELLDSGVVGAAEKVAAKFHVGARHVERAAREYRWLIGYFPGDRGRFRAWRVGVGDDEFNADILMNLRQRGGQPAIGADGDIAELLKNAPAFLENLREEWSRKIRPVAVSQDHLEISPITNIDSDDGS